MKIAVTGHRPNKLGQEYNMKGPFSNWIRKELEAIISGYKPSIMISGMALGVDTIWALLALKLGIGLWAIPAFDGMEMKWPHESKKVYNDIINLVKEKRKSNTFNYKVIFPSIPPYAPYKMQVRNEWMVNNCDLLVAVWDGSEGGTCNCVRYAESVKKEIIRLDPSHLYKQKP